MVVGKVMNATNMSATPFQPPRSKNNNKSACNIPNIFPIRRHPWRLRRSISIHCIGGTIHQPILAFRRSSAVGHLGRVARRRSRAACLAAERVEVLKVPLRHRGDVLAAKDTHFKVLRLAGGELGAARFEVVEVLVDDFVGANVLGNVETVPLVGNEFAGGGKVDTAVKWSARVNPLDDDMERMVLTKCEDE